MIQNSRVEHTLIAYLRHELCTPINTMMGYSAMLLEDVHKEPQTNLIADLHKIHDCSKQLSTLVNALLDSAQLELSQIDGDLHRFGSTLRMEILTPLSTIVGYCKMLLEKAPSKGIADLDKIDTAARQMLNLVNNIVHLAQQQLPTLTAPESAPQLAIDMSNRSYSLEDLVQSPSKLSQLALAANLITSQPPQPASPSAALQRLLEGNQRFVDEACQNPQRSQSRIQETASDQYPFASILGCADSRVPAEIIFDQGLGDLFVVRVAGNVASQTAIGSLEFATLVLGTQLIVVVGHSGCGAVAAAIKGEPLPGRIGTFVEEIKPAIARAKDKIGELTENTVIVNIQRQAQKLVESSILADSLQAGKLKIVGGQYDLHTGKFTLVT
jgi:carbonic anhydrase